MERLAKILLWARKHWVMTILLIVTLVHALAYLSIYLIRTLGGVDAETIRGFVIEIQILAAIISGLLGLLFFKKVKKREDRD